MLDADLGPRWRSGEPERFNPDFWEDRTVLKPQRNINLQGLPDGAQPGDKLPGDLFLRVDRAEVCVIDVAWVTLEMVG